MDNAVALAAISLAGGSMGGVIWLAKYFAKQLSHDLQEHTKAAQNNAQASDEMLKFMRNLNGKLENAYIQKVQEQTVINVQEPEK